MEKNGILPNTLADSNLIKAVKLRGLINEDIVKPTSANPFIHHLNKLHTHTMQLCSTRGYASKFRRILEQELLDVTAWKTFQEAKTLNWCKEVRKQFPLKVSGEGNSLLHSISLYMWAVQDTDHVLQKTLHEALVKTHDANFKLRLRTEYRKAQEFLDPALFHESEIWDQEWQNVIKSVDPRSSAGQTLTKIYQDVHIFVLANIVRRPIVVIVGNSEGSSKSASFTMTSSPAGIYLPLHWPPHHCHNYPILLSYVNQYFTPLVSINDVGPEINAFPLVVPSKDGTVELPTRFLLDAEKGDRTQLLKSYLTEIPVPDCHSVEFVNAARLFINPLPDDLNLVEDYFQLVNHQYKFWQEDIDKEQSVGNEEELTFLSNLSIVGDKCLTHGCTYFCSKFTKPFCHVCHNAFQKKEMSSGANNWKQSGNQGAKEYLKELQSERTTIFGPQDIRKESTPPASPSHIPFFSETNALKCKTSHCPFTGTVAQNGLCPSCFHRNDHLEYSPEGDSNSEPCFPKLAGELVDERMDLWGERCSNCKQEIRKFNGLCFSCLKTMDSLAKSHARTEHIPSDALQVALAYTGTHGAVLHQDQRQKFSQTSESGKCRNPNCQYFGTEEQNGFCTTCFFKYVEEIGASGEQDPFRQQSNPPPPHGHLVQISSQLKNMSVCCKPDCSMLANPVYSGYCEKCYVNTQNKHLKRLEASSDIPTDQHAWSPVVQRCYNYNPSNNQRLSERTTNEHFGLELVRSRTNISEPSQICTLSSSDQQNPEPKRNLCRTHNCKHFGNAKCDGYCNACFTTSQMLRK
ncbi:tumor necrosis factor alpha-induced protein 3-like isoform X1 [Carcharodon carcharias]|uniref:tumor necrosis factor alpha-induced protein 3-like isoform X1 n=2 Tax=Carcharodon carcharias TaxID=13397 RepID=UPI001B7E399E|nr:tumor necrosis factor alpha-induced protein 3-like isoform X1 [Carcharodon carcharias]